MTSLLYPIFFPVILWGSLISVWVLFSATPPSNFLAAGAFGVIISLWGAVLQLFLGIPSLFLLRRWRSLRAHLVVGGALGCAVASAAAVALLRDGESVFRAVPGWALFVLPPFLVGYARLYYARARELTLQNES